MSLEEMEGSRGEILHVQTDNQGRITGVHLTSDGRNTLLVGYSYDELGNMVSTEDALGTVKRFRYEGHQLVELTNQSGMSFHWEYDGKEVSFAYDALGRRIRKTYAGTTTHFVWDGNVPLHEWTEEAEENVVTWLFEQDTFVPAAKLVANGDCFSIISDYLGTPLQAYDK